MFPEDASNTQQQKRALRREFLARRQAMPHALWREKSEAIARRVLAMPEVQHAGTVLAYVSSKDNEVDTIAIIEALLREGHRVAAPRVTGPGLMEWRLIASMQDLAPGEFGVLEPRVEQTELYEDFRPTDVCLVPGVAWDRRGYRVGYGMGFFDRFLRGFPGLSMGLAFSEQLSEFPVESHDMAVAGMVVE
jgi:5-formyltetrahydrofolate cyclo-ligase